ncbi:MAG: hypothetical protein CMJ64_28835 [Planctomycetaceae bacterium]|nr:hypothetical protein [Planctomycetaceae bacterium]
MLSLEAVVVLGTCLGILRVACPWLAVRWCHAGRGARRGPYDRIWGIGFCESDGAARDPLRWRGDNLLGFALMDVRASLAG